MESCGEEIFTRARVVYEKLYEDASLPKRATQHSAGMDVFAYLRGRTLSVYNPSPVRGTREAVMEVRAEVGRPVGPEEIEVVAGVTLYPGERVIIPLGFKATLPEGYQAEIRARSSWALKRGLIVPNAPGTIDADYPDEWGVILANIGHRPEVIYHGDRIAQVVLMPYRELVWTAGIVGVTTDRTGGIGSTG